MPQLDPTWFASQLFWLAIMFLALYAVLSRVMLPPIMDIIARRKDTIEGDIGQAQGFKSQAETARQEYERLLAETRGQVQQLMSDALATHKVKAEAANKAMDQEIEKKLTEATRRINAKKQELLDVLKPAAADLTAMIVEKLTKAKPAGEQVSRALGNVAKAGR